jgi:hypothetical protein
MVSPWCFDRARDTGSSFCRRSRVHGVRLEAGNWDDAWSLEIGLSMMPSECRWWIQVTSRPWRLFHETPQLQLGFDIFSSWDRMLIVLPVVLQTPSKSKRPWKCWQQQAIKASSVEWSTIEESMIGRACLNSVTLRGTISKKISSSLSCADNNP